jgi:hypothetical protein
MSEEQLIEIMNQTVCDQKLHRSYTQKRFDILNRFEQISIRCINCHKTLSLEVKKVS